MTKLLYNIIINEDNEEFKYNNVPNEEERIEAGEVESVPLQNDNLDIPVDYHVIGVDNELFHQNLYEEIDEDVQEKWQ